MEKKIIEIIDGFLKEYLPQMAIVVDEPTRGEVREAIVLGGIMCPKMFDVVYNTLINTVNDNKDHIDLAYGKSYVYPALLELYDYLKDDRSLASIISLRSNEVRIIDKDVPSRGYNWRWDKLYSKEEITRRLQVISEYGLFGTSSIPDASEIHLYATVDELSTINNKGGFKYGFRGLIKRDLLNKVSKLMDDNIIYNNDGKVLSVRYKEWFIDIEINWDNDESDKLRLGSIKSINRCNGVCGIANTYKDDYDLITDMGLSHTEYLEKLKLNRTDTKYDIIESLFDNGYIDKTMFVIEEKTD